MILKYLHYDVFTGEALLGNQLAVFPDAEGLEASLMQRLAREMNFSESTFIMPAEQGGTDVRMRIFTPGSELPMAGHPTIGSTFALAHLGVITPASGRFVFGLNIGPTPVDLQWNGASLSFAWMTQRSPTFGRIVSDRALAAAALGLEASDLADPLPVQDVSCGVPFLIVPVRSVEAVDRAVSDIASVRRLHAAIGASLPIFFFAKSPGSNGETVHSRMFAPGFGITEDPATGGASGPLGCYLLKYGLVDSAEARTIVSLQGVAMGRASRIHIAIGGRPEAIDEVKVGGEAVLVGQGELFV